jgi:hypothetical protein
LNETLESLQNDLKKAKEETKTAKQHADEISVKVKIYNEFFVIVATP